MARVLIPLAQGCEELEAVTLTDLLTRAGVDVITAGLQQGPVTASRGMVLLPETTLEQVEGQQFDMIALPGGLPGADHLNSDQRLHRLLQEVYQQGGYVAAICAAPKVLATAGLLQGRSATAYPGTLEQTDANITRLADPVVVDGRVVTSRGPGTAMDFALQLIELLVGRARREEVEAGLVR